MDSVTFLYRNDGENPITKSGLKSPATVSAMRAIMQPGSPALQSAVTSVPIGSGLLFASSGTLPQIHVVRPPGLMKFRPNAAPDEPGAGKRGPLSGSYSIVCRFFVNV